MVDFFVGVNGWMDVGGVWGEGKKRGVLWWVEFLWKGEGKGSWLWYWMVGGWSRDDFWLLVLLLRVGIVRIIILMYSYYQSA